jgi:hypothetical protein
LQRSRLCPAGGRNITPLPKTISLSPISHHLISLDALCGFDMFWAIGAGVLAVGIGWLWNLQFPVIKKIWTSSLVLVADGYSAVLMGGFYLMADVWKKQWWCQPFVWIGMNSITIYLVKNILGSFGKLAARFGGRDIKTFSTRT